MTRRSALVLLALLAALLGAVLGVAPAPAVAAAPARHAGARVVLVFLPRTVYKVYNANNPTVLDTLGARSKLALGLLGPTQGRYDQTQALLDMTAGTRVSQSTYSPTKPPLLTFSRVGAIGVMYGWYAALQRAAGAPADVHPGSLASLIPGGAAFAGVAGGPHPEAIAATDGDGLVRDTSLGHTASLTARTLKALARHRLVVVSLPQQEKGIRVLDEILRARRPGWLVMVLQTPPGGHASQLLPLGIAGLPSNGALTSQTTHRHGIVAGIDLAPTALRHLGIRVPGEMKGEPITTEGVRDAANLHSLGKRLGVIAARRLPAFEVFMFAWLAVLLALGLWRDRGGWRMGMRWGGLAIMWLPTMMLVTAWLNPSRTNELVVLGVGSFVAAALTDRFVRWPRAPAVPAIVGLVLYTIDLAESSQLIVRSLLGPNPRSGSRFYGIGNELEITLTLLLLVGVAAALPWRGRSRKGALTFGLCGLVMAAVIGSGRLGADVGGVFTVGGGTAVAVLLMLPGGVSRRAVILAVLAPIVGLALLAGLDLVTGGNGHFTRTVLHANSSSDLWDTFKRRNELAFNNLKHGFLPLISAVCLLAGAYGVRHRRRIYGALAIDRPWIAGMGGAFAGAIVGSLTNDSGPLLLLIGTVGLACVTAYLRGGQPLTDAGAGGPPGGVP